MEASARIYVMKSPSRKTQGELCPVRLCITYDRERRYYSIKEKIKKDEWLFLKSEEISKVLCDSPRGKYKEIKVEYDRIVEEAKGKINNISSFSFGKFEDEFFRKTSDWDNVITAFIDHIQGLKSEGRFGYASSFESTLRSIIEHHTNRELTYTNRERVEKRYNDYMAVKKLFFSDITHQWLKQYEKWLYKKGKSKSTVGIYMRNIRVIFNLAIKKHKIKVEYPFMEYKPGESTGRKLALTASQIRLIADYRGKDPVKLFYRDLFMFSFLGNGINPSDIARLKYSNIVGDTIMFVREKTKNKTHQAEISIPISAQMRRIIDHHSNKAIGHDAYLFPILKSNMTEERKYMEIKQFTKVLNRHIREVAGEVGIKERVSSYTARHSWATISKNSGTSTEFIKEALGHSNILVTEKYLKSFEETTRKEHSEKIEKQIYSHG